MRSLKKPRNIKRWLKLKYTELMRAPGGPSFVALGFAIGIAIEMITLPTYGLAFFLIFPLVYWLRASLTGALIGFVAGKIIYLPIAFVNTIVGGWILSDKLNPHIPYAPHWLDHALLVNMKLIVGGTIDGLLLGFLFYFPVRFAIHYMAEKRREKRRLKRSHIAARALAE